jgi:serine/threonine protein kinase
MCKQPSSQNKPIPRKVELQDMGKPGFLLSDAEVAWLENYLRKNPKAHGKITKQCSEGNLPYPVLLIRKNRYAIYKGTEDKALGKGGFGQVRIGQNIKTGQWVSIKIQLVKNNDKLRIKEVTNEATFAKEHGFLLDTIEIKTKNVKKIYFVQKLLGEGDDLHHHLFVETKSQIANFDEKLNIAISTLKELKNKFHDKNILHRDLKPSNIIYDKARNITMFIDFGAIVDLNKVPLRQLLQLNNLEKLGDNFYAKTKPKRARILDKNTYFYEKEPFLTEGYSAPEINNLENALYSKHSDIYALGVCFYYLITVNKKNEKNVIPSTIAFYNLVAKMCSYDPRNRPSVNEALSMLKKIKARWQQDKKGRLNRKNSVKKPLSFTKNISLKDSEKTLLEAAKRGDLEMVKLLIRKYDINTIDNSGYTPLMHAITKCQNEIVKLLLLNKNIDINKKDKEGYTALMKAIEMNNIEAVILLLTDRRIDLTINKFAFTLIRSQAVKKLTDHLVKLKVAQRTV